MRVLEGLPDLVWGRPWSRLVPWPLQGPLERLAFRSAYRRGPAAGVRLRSGPVTATLVVAGDLALHHGPDPDASAHVFGAVRPVFADADLGIVNLESVLTSRDAPAGHIGRFLRAPPEAAACLQYLGIAVASSANNHALDHGAEGLAECGEALRRAGISWLGVDEGHNHAVAGAVVREVRGLTVGLLAATDHFGGVPTGSPPAPVWLDERRLLHDVRELRRRCHVVVVQLHWGYEHVMYPLRWHRDLARAVVDAGADLVCCHHAHVVMGLEAWGRGAIAHGLGDFYFGARPRPHPFRRFGIVLRASADSEGLVAVDVVPVCTHASGAVHVEKDACPGFDRLCTRLADDRHLDRVERGRIAHTMAGLGTELGARLALGDTNGLLERQAFLRAPRQDWLLQAAGAAPEWQALGKWLAAFRSLPAQSVSRLALPALPELDALPRLGDARLLPGRLP